MYIPNVFYKKDGFKDRNSDLFSRLLSLGHIYINDTITSTTSTLFLAAAQHIVLDLNLSNITVYINSPGGDLYSGLAIVDIIRFGFVDVKFKTVCIGLAASAASIILAAGHIRSVSSNSRIMIHQPLGGIQGQATDIHLYADQIMEAKETLIQMYTEFSGGKTTACYFRQAIERDKFLSGKQALALGIIDSIFGYSFTPDKPYPSRCTCAKCTKILENNKLE